MSNSKQPQRPQTPSPPPPPPPQHQRSLSEQRRRPPHMLSPDSLARISHSPAPLTGSPLHPQRGREATTSQLAPTHEAQQQASGFASAANPSSGAAPPMSERAQGKQRATSPSSTPSNSIPAIPFTPTPFAIPLSSLSLLALHDLGADIDVEALAPLTPNGQHRTFTIYTTPPFAEPMESGEEYLQRLRWIWRSQEVAARFVMREDTETEEFWGGMEVAQEAIEGKVEEVRRFCGGW